MMLVLLAIGFLAGVITAVSPCVLPVLPILLAGSASGGRRRPYAIIAGLVASFTVFTLTAAWLLDQLGLPKDFLRNLALVLLFLLAATLIFPQVGRLLERPFLPLTRRRGGNLGGGFVLGLSLGLVFVPCAGPVLAAVTVLAANRSLDAESFLLTFSYALGAALPMLAVAVTGNRAVGATKLIRTHAQSVRRVLGVVIAATALAIVFNVDRRFQTAVPGYTEALQRQVERSGPAERELARVRGAPSGAARAEQSAPLEDYGAAPDFVGVSQWLNTPAGSPLSLPHLRGNVVLVDFWTYSCINCLRTLPYVKAWDSAYRRRGLTIVGVHTPEFAFEHVASNVRKAVSSLGIRYPVAIDNDYETWNAYSNQYWPAKYLIDRRGHVRYAHFGEGEYEETEMLIRRLLAERPVRLPPPVEAKAKGPSGERTTPETYLGYARIDRYAGSAIHNDRPAAYQLPTALEQDELALGGVWRVGHERSVAGRGARLQLRYYARDVHLVLGGSGRVDVFLNGKRHGRVAVRGSRLYTLVNGRGAEEGLLELRFAPGVSAYAFTFG